MSQSAPSYCIDANVLIQAWQKYYSPSLCPSYWDELIQLGKEKRIFIPEMVQTEILRTEDDLADWLKSSAIPIRKIGEGTTKKLQEIYAFDPKHKRLVDSIKGRSLADPWVIAHALEENATVVTKEELVTAANTDRIRIPNVCRNMGVRYMNDFQFVDEVNIRFDCSRK